MVVDTKLFWQTNYVIYLFKWVMFTFELTTQSIVQHSTNVCDSLEELKRACVNYMSTSVENMILSKNVTFLKKEVSNIKVTEISGEKWIGRKPNEFLDYLAKTFRNSNVDLIYVTDLMHDYVDPSKFMSKINQDNEYNVMYDTIGKWLDGLDLSSPMYIGEEDHIGVEMEWDLDS
jgi:hypothetical protein